MTWSKAKARPDRAIPPIERNLPTLKTTERDVATVTKASGRKAFNLADRYSLSLSREHPRLWATRLDIPILFLIAGIAFVTLWQPPVWRTGVTPTIVVGEPRALIIFAACGIVSIFFGIYWISSELNSLGLPFAPRLRSIPWAITAHVATLLIFLPSLLALYYSVNSYPPAGSQNLEDLYLVGPGIGLAITSLLAVVPVVARRFGFQQALGGTLISIIVILAILFVSITWFQSIGTASQEWLLEFTPGFYPHDMRPFFLISIPYLVFLTAAVLIKATATNTFLRYLVYFPTLIASTAGPLMLTLGPLYLGDQSLYGKHTSAWEVDIFLRLLGVYGLSAIVIEVLLRRSNNALRASRI
jgi:hypothetical protein